MIAGPNGAGKTTFAREFLPHEADCSIFINADLIAEGLSPFRPRDEAFRAGRVMLELMHDHVRRGESFAFETTLSGRTYSRLIPRWRCAGFRVKLIFLSVADEEQAVARVRFRVSQGGHDIPEHVIRRRFRAGLRNFNSLYKRLVDEWVLYDNSSPSPIVVQSGENV
jgi:predicted ABC-type ATPase